MLLSRLLLIGMAASLCMPAQVRSARDQISILVDDKPSTTFHYGTDSNKPYLDLYKEYAAQR